MHARPLALAAIAALVAMTNPSAAAGPDEFVISLEQAVSDGVPGPGAGNIETNGAEDIYTFTAAPGTMVYFDEQGGPCTINWTCVDSNTNVVFSDGAFCSTDPGLRELTLGGEYTITVTGNAGTFSFVVWEVNVPDEFAIGLEQPVSDGAPAAGAGNIEEPGALDIYTFTVAPGTEVFFDEISGPCGIRWQCHDSLDQLIFSDSAMCSTDPGTHELTLGGEYTLTVYGNGSTTGTYSFTLWEVNPPDVFELEFDEVVADGAPGAGAGNIEEPGTIDVYTIDVEAGTLAYFDELSGPCGIRWICEDPIGGEVFSDLALCSTDPGAHLLTMEGTYTITVYGNQSTIGTYSFAVSIVNPVDAFAIGLEQTISDGVPGAGAGNIEEAGAIDEYTFSAAAGTEVFFDALSGPCNILMECRDPFDAPLFVNGAMCLSNHGQFTLAHTGEYTVSVRGNGGATGTYSFTIWEVDPPQQFAIAIGDTVSNGVPAAGAGNIEEPGAVDVYTFNATPGQSVCFAEVIDNCSLRWSCEDSNGTPIFADETLCAANVGKYELALGGEYTVTVRGIQDGVGSYGFALEFGRATDINGDCTVNVTDLLQLLADWGPCPGGAACPSDTNDSGAVDVTDLLALLAEWG